MLTGLLDILKEGWWWVVAAMLSIVDGVLDSLMAVWPQSWQSPIGDVAEYLRIANHWVPLSETIAFMCVWVLVVGIYFIIKVILYLF